MERFAGLALQSGTSMNLGYAGEMYANFGRWGGVAMCGLYAMVLGLLLRMVTKKASKSMLWWIFVPYVGHLALKAEDGVAEVMNWVVKSLLICVLVYLAFPALRAALSGHVLTPPESQRAAVRRRRRSRQRVSDASSNPEPEPSEA